MSAYLHKKFMKLASSKAEDGGGNDSGRNATKELKHSVGSLVGATSSSKNSSHKKSESVEDISPASSPPLSPTLYPPKAYYCDICRFAFRLKENLDKHTKSPSHFLKLDKGIDSTEATILSELGDSAIEETSPTPIGVKRSQQSAAQTRQNDRKPEENTVDSNRKLSGNVVKPLPAPAVATTTATANLPNGKISELPRIGGGAAAFSTAAAPRIQSHPAGPVVTSPMDRLKLAEPQPQQHANNSAAAAATLLATHHQAAATGGLVDPAYLKLLAAQQRHMSENAQGDSRGSGLLITAGTDPSVAKNAVKDPTVSYQDALVNNIGMGAAITATPRLPVNLESTMPGPHYQVHLEPGHAKASPRHAEAALAPRHHLEPVGPARLPLVGGNSSKSASSRHPVLLEPVPGAGRAAGLYHAGSPISTHYPRHPAVVGLHESGQPHSYGQPTSRREFPDTKVVPAANFDRHGGLIAGVGGEKAARSTGASIEIIAATSGQVATGVGVATNNLTRPENNISPVGIPPGQSLSHHAQGGLMPGPQIMAHSRGGPTAPAPRLPTNHSVAARFLNHHAAAQQPASSSSSPSSSQSSAAGYYDSRSANSAGSGRRGSLGNVSATAITLGQQHHYAGSGPLLPSSKQGVSELSGGKVATQRRMSTGAGPTITSVGGGQSAQHQQQGLDLRTPAVNASAGGGGAPPQSASGKPQQDQPTDLSRRSSIGAADQLAIEQRINKVISENQAIVETLDPKWKFRYMRQSSRDSNSGEASEISSARGKGRRSSQTLLATSLPSSTAAQITSAKNFSSVETAPNSSAAQQSGRYYLTSAGHGNQGYKKQVPHQEPDARGHPNGRGTDNPIRHPQQRPNMGQHALPPVIPHSTTTKQLAVAAAAHAQQLPTASRPQQQLHGGHGHEMTKQQLDLVKPTGISNSLQQELAKQPGGGNNTGLAHEGLKPHGINSSLPQQLLGGRTAELTLPGAGAISYSLVTSLAQQPPRPDSNIPLNLAMDSGPRKRKAEADCRVVGNSHGDSRAYAKPQNSILHDAQSVKEVWLNSQRKTNTLAPQVAQDQSGPTATCAPAPSASTTATSNMSSIGGGATLMLASSHLAPGKAYLDKSGNSSELAKSESESGERSSSLVSYHFLLKQQQQGGGIVPGTSSAAVSHPDNPEGSVIKDLLLKQRAADAALAATSANAAQANSGDLQNSRQSPVSALPEADKDPSESVKMDHDSVGERRKAEGSVTDEPPSKRGRKSSLSEEKTTFDTIRLPVEAERVSPLSSQRPKAGVSPCGPLRQPTAFTVRPSNIPATYVQALGIPAPNISGVLTGIKPSPLFSLPGLRQEAPGVSSPSLRGPTGDLMTMTSSTTSVTISTSLSPVDTARISTSIRPTRVANVDPIDQSAGMRTNAGVISGAADNAVKLEPVTVGSELLAGSNSQLTVSGEATRVANVSGGVAVPILPFPAVAVVTRSGNTTPNRNTGGPSSDVVLMMPMPMATSTTNTITFKSSTNAAQQVETSRSNPGQAIGSTEEGSQQSPGAPGGATKPLKRPTTLSFGPPKPDKSALAAPFGSKSTNPSALPLESPETPRPRKAYALHYQNGTAYTYLGLKCSTRVFFCSTHKAQPNYVELESNSMVSMYSNWKVVEEDSHPSKIPPKEWMTCYNSSYPDTTRGIFSTAQTSKASMITTHSSWKLKGEAASKPVEAGNKDEDNNRSSSQSSSSQSGSFLAAAASSSAANSLAVSRTDANPAGIAKKPVEGGYKSNDDNYTYIRGRGRGKYICDECGIRCKKPSMLKKHIRTHTNVRPYTCRYCNFSFKTKGNLTKHMKSKAHSKKCVELGLPVRADDSAAIMEGGPGNPADGQDSKDGDHNRSDDPYSHGDPSGLGGQRTGGSTGIGGSSGYSSGAGGSMYVVEDSDDSNGESGDDLDDLDDEEDSEDGCQEDPSYAASAGPSSTTSIASVASSLSSNAQTSDINRSSVSSSAAYSEASLLGLAPWGIPRFSTYPVLSSAGGNSQNRPQSGGAGNQPRPVSGDGLPLAAVTPEQAAGSNQPTTFPQASESGRTPPAASTSSATNLLVPLSVITTSHGYATLTPVVTSSQKDILTTGPSAILSYIGAGLLQVPVSAHPHGLYGTQFAHHNTLQPKSVTDQRQPQLPQWTSMEDGLKHYLLERAAVKAKQQHEQCSTSSQPSENGQVVVKEEAMDVDETSSSLPKVEEETPHPKPSQAGPAQDVPVVKTEPDLPAVTESTVPTVPRTQEPQTSRPAPPNHTIPFTGPHSIMDTIPQNVTMNVKDIPSILPGQTPPPPPEFNIPQINKANAKLASGVGHGNPKQVPTSSVDLATPTSSRTTDSSGSKPGPNEAKSPIPGPSQAPEDDLIDREQDIFQVNEDGKAVCGICRKVFNKSSQLRLHVNIHYFERPFRCEACAVSFRTKGHLQKHKRSVGHFNKVNINATFGAPSTDNPRPFKCTECMTAFRIHGHLAKHLRSKVHIMKLECIGKLPIGMFADLERMGFNLNDIDTTDCENSLDSLQLLAGKLYENDPSKLASISQGPPPPQEQPQPTQEDTTAPTTSSDISEDDDSNQHGQQHQQHAQATQVKEEPVDSSPAPGPSGSHAPQHLAHAQQSPRGGALRQASPRDSGPHLNYHHPPPTASAHNKQQLPPSSESLHPLHGGLSNSITTSLAQPKPIHASVLFAPSAVVDKQQPPLQYSPRQQQHQQHPIINNVPRAFQPVIVASGGGGGGSSQPLHRNSPTANSSPQPRAAYQPPFIIQQQHLNHYPSATVAALKPQQQPPASNVIVGGVNSSPIGGQPAQLLPSGGMAGQPGSLLVTSTVQAAAFQHPYQVSPVNNRRSPIFVASSGSPSPRAGGGHPVGIASVAAVPRISYEYPAAGGSLVVVGGTETAGATLAPPPNHHLPSHPPHHITSASLALTAAVVPTIAGIRAAPAATLTIVNSSGGGHHPAATAYAGFTCSICGLQLPDHISFQQHMASHAKPRPFVCRHCDAGFTSAVQLESHAALHQKC